MKKVKGSKFDTLVVTGCSHTQGCAFTVNNSKDEKGFVELATTQLKKKYGQQKVSTKFITELTWGGKINNFLKCKNIINLGFGGYGIESCIRALRAYMYYKHDLKNHLIIMQIPSPTRKEVLFRKEGFASPYTSVETIKNLIDPSSTVPYKEMYYEHYVDFEIFEGNFIFDLFHLQEYLESKGATVRFIDEPFGDWGIVTINQWNTYLKAYDSWRLRGWTDTLKFPKINEIFNKLNIINISSDVLLNGDGERRATLHAEGLRKDDKHLSEKGNELLAEGLWNNIDNLDVNKPFPKLPDQFELVRKTTLI